VKGVGAGCLKTLNKIYIFAAVNEDLIFLQNLNPPTFISSIKCSTGNLSKVFDAIDMTCGAKQPHDEEYDESDEEDDDAEDDEEMEASDTVIEETVSEDFVKAHMTSTSEAASASSTTSDPIPMKRARSRESNVDDDAAEEEPPEVRVLLPA
jgi:hypothetical protein